MSLLCRIALLAIPLSLVVAVAIIQLDHLHNDSLNQINRYLPNTTLLVIAHPDDETMFFGPTILSLLDSGKHLHILCLSGGNLHSHGDEGRKQELNKVVSMMGPNAVIKIIEDKRLVDGMNEKWSPDVIRDHVMEYLNTAKGASQIRALISFDSYGISRHPNHRDIHEALVLMKQTEPNSDLKHFYLNSINLFRKYISFMDAIIMKLSGFTLLATNSHELGAQNQLVVALNFQQNKRLRQLLNLHNSQMVWFRKLYQLFSRYMFINDLTIA